MMRAEAVTFAIGLLAVVAIVSACEPALAPLRPWVTLPLVLLLPGWAVTRLFVSLRTLSFASLVLACGLSLAITVIVGLLLNAGSVMTPFAWIGALGGVTLCACGLRVFTKAGSGSPLAESHRFSMTMGQGVLLAMASVITILAIELARTGAIAQHEYSFTEFWMVPRKPVEQNFVTIGVNNEEKMRMSYRIVMVSDDAIIGRWPSVALDPGATWTTEISLNSELRHSQKIQAWLYRNDRPENVYRKVWLANSAN